MRATASSRAAPSSGGDSPKVTVKVRAKDGDSARGVAVGAGLMEGNGRRMSPRRAICGAAVVGGGVGTCVGSRQHPFSVRVTSSEGSEAPALFSATTVSATVETQATLSSSAKLSVSAVRRRQPLFASHSLSNRLC